MTKLPDLQIRNGVPGSAALLLPPTRRKEKQIRAPGSPRKKQRPAGGVCFSQVWAVGRDLDTPAKSGVDPHSVSLTHQ